MSQAAKKMRESLEHSLDALTMIAWNDGYEAALNAIDELSNKLHNTNNESDSLAAEVLRWLVKELKGENIVEAN